MLMEPCADKMCLAYGGSLDTPFTVTKSKFSEIERWEWKGNLLLNTKCNKFLTVEGDEGEDVEEDSLIVLAEGMPPGSQQRQEWFTSGGMLCPKLRPELCLTYWEPQTGF